MVESLNLFDGHKIRSQYDEENDIWFFSVVDVVAILVDKDYQSARKYWKVLKGSLENEGGLEVVTFCYQLKMEASDGKKYMTDVANAEIMLRIVQSIPSPKAEPIKRWLAELSTRQIAESVEASGMEENIETCVKGGKIAKNARLSLEEKTGKKVVVNDNYIGQETDLKFIEKE